MLNWGSATIRELFGHLSEKNSDSCHLIRVDPLELLLQLFIGWGAREGPEIICSS